MREGIFNHDLLTGPGDVAAAEGRFPRVAKAFIFEGLQKKFLQIDVAANLAKRRSRRLGVGAVIMVLIALLIASAEAIVHSQLPENTERTVLLVAAVLGVVGGAMGSMGVLVGRQKRRWLLGRLRTERLRQLHFQFLVRRAQQIAAALGNPDAEALLLRERENGLGVFVHTYQKWGEGAFDETIDDLESKKAWLVDEVPWNGSPPPPAALDELFEAYRMLRFDEQTGYASYKLRNDTALISAAPRRQRAVIDLASILLIAASLVAHLVIAVSGFAGVDLGGWATYLHIASVWFALLALALLVLKEGLRPREEIERYRDYLLAIKRIEDRFNGARHTSTRLAAMEEMEELAYDEMRRFLIGYDEAKFSL